jgi:hypothetical protein
LDGQTEPIVSQKYLFMKIFPNLRIVSALCLAIMVCRIEAVNVVTPKGDRYSYASEVDYWESIAPLLHDYMTLEKIEILKTEGQIEGLFANLVSDAVITIKANEALFWEVDRKERDRILSRRDFYTASRSVSRIIRKLAIAGESVSIPVKICTLQSPSGFVVGPLSPILDGIRPPSEFQIGAGIMYQVPVKGDAPLNDPKSDQLLGDMLELITGKPSLIGFMSMKEGMSEASFFEWKNISKNNDGTLSAMDSDTGKPVLLTPMVYQFADSVYVFLETTLDFQGREYPLYFAFDSAKKELLHSKQKELVRQDPGPKSVLIPLDDAVIASYQKQFDRMAGQKQFLTKDWRELLPPDEKLIWVGNELKNIDTLETYLTCSTKDLIFIEEYPGLVYFLKNRPESFDPAKGYEWRITGGEFERWKRDNQSRKYFGITEPFNSFQLVNANGSISLEKRATPFEESFLKKEKVEFYLSNTLQQVMYVKDGDIWMAEVDWANNTIIEPKNITNLGIIEGITFVGWYKDWLYFKNSNNEENPLLKVNTATKQILELPWPFKTDFFVNPSHSIVLQESDDEMGLEVLNLHTDERFSILTIGDSKFSILFWFNDYTFFTENYIYDLSERRRYPLVAINPEIPAFLKKQRNIEYDPYNNCIKGAYALWDLDSNEIKKTRIKYPARAWIGKEAIVFNVFDEGINRDGTYYKRVDNDELVKIAEWPSVGNVVGSKGSTHVVFGTQPSDTYRLNVFDINENNLKVYELGEQTPYLGRYSFRSSIYPSMAVEDSLWFISGFAKAQSQQLINAGSAFQEIEYIPDDPSSDGYKFRKEFWGHIGKTIVLDRINYSTIYLLQIASKNNLLPDTSLERKIELMAFHAMSELLKPYMLGEEGSESPNEQSKSKLISNPQMIVDYSRYFAKRYVAYVNAVTNEYATDLRELFSAAELSGFKDYVTQIKQNGKQGPKSRTQLETNTVLEKLDAYLDDPRVTPTSQSSFDAKIRADSNYAFSPTSVGIPEPFTHDQSQWLLTRYFVDLFFSYWGSSQLIYDTWESQN